MYYFTETHPLLNAKSRDKVSQQTKKTGKSKQHRVNSHSEKNSHRSKHGNKNKEKVSSKCFIVLHNDLEIIKKYIIP